MNTHETVRGSSDASIKGNLYNLQELAGAFGDLGTLIPFVVGYITINHMDPAGILVGFGVFKLWAGLYFKTPVPIQPMKAIGTAAITQGGAITPGAIFASGLFTGVVWGFMGALGRGELDREDHPPAGRAGHRAGPGPGVRRGGREDDARRPPPRRHRGCHDASCCSRTRASRRCWPCSRSGPVSPWCASRPCWPTSPA
ncbi:MAG: hypothetical protein MZV70_30195 [Desulfobacterales bacterium]|nr:hypothetical protein [Desulfobacterales bacterium]